MTIKATAAVHDTDVILDTADIFAMATILAIKYKLLKNTYKKERLQLKSLSLLLGYPDSNQEKQDQNLLCYHYTISQGYLSHSEQVPLVLNCGAKVLLFYELAKVL